MATLKIKVNGVWEDIPAIQGVDGKSAYQSALDGGYVGTEVEFNSDLSLVSEKMNIDGSNSLVENLTFVGNGVLSYDGDRQILQYTNPDGTTNDVGAELWFSEGKASGAIANGAPVQFAGVQGDHYLFKTAVPSEINANPSLFMGIATSDIANNAWGKVTHFGVVHDINTNGWSAGTILWFDSVNGGLTSTKPSYPNAQIQVCAVVVQNSTVGSIIVRPTVYQDAYTRSETDTLLSAKAPLASPIFTGTVSGITKAMVGLGNVDNTSDVNKPVSTAQQTQINTRQLKNWIINGGFDVWQRGVSQTNSGYGSDDRFANLHDGISTKTHSRQTFVVGQTDVPNNPTYFSRTIVTSGNTSNSAVYKGQKIEDVTKLAGKIVTISFWAKADSNKNMAILLLQNFGSGGSSDAVATIQKFALTTSWQRFTKTVTIPSAIGKTIGANSFLHLHIFFDAGSAYNPITDSLGNQSGTFDIANVSLVEGSVPVEWQTEAYADVLRQCQRYYLRFNGSSSANEVFLNSGNTFNSGSAYFAFILPNEMRISPTNIEYSGVRIGQIGIATISTSSIAFLANNSSKQSVLLNAIGTGFPATAWQVINLAFANYIDSYLAFNAEL